MVHKNRLNMWLRLFAEQPASTTVEQPENNRRTNRAGGRKGRAYRARVKRCRASLSWYGATPNERCIIGSNSIVDSWTEVVLHAGASIEIGAPAEIPNCAMPACMGGRAGGRARTV